MKFEFQVKKKIQIKFMASILKLYTGFGNELVYIINDDTVKSTSKYGKYYLIKPSASKKYLN